MTSTDAKPDEYRRYAQDCWKIVNDAQDVETKAVFQLTAEAWAMLAAQVESLESTQVSEAINIPPLLQSAA